MEKTYSQLLVIIARKDLELAKLRERIERENREYNEVYRLALESHKRDLETVALGYQKSVDELSEKVEYWQENTETARKERDKLYGEVNRWQDEYKTVDKLKEKYKEFFKGMETDFQAMKIKRDNVSEELLAYKRCNQENCETIDRLRTERDKLLEELKQYKKPEFIELLGFEDFPNSRETSPETSPESPNGWDSV